MHHPYVLTPDIGLATRTVQTVAASARILPTILVNRNAIDARLACALPSG